MPALRDRQCAAWATAVSQISTAQGTLRTGLLNDQATLQGFSNGAYLTGYLSQVTAWKAASAIPGVGPGYLHQSAEADQASAYTQMLTAGLTYPTAYANAWVSSQTTDGALDSALYDADASYQQTTLVAQMNLGLLADEATDAAGSTYAYACTAAAVLQLNNDADSSLTQNNALSVSQHTQNRARQPGRRNLDDHGVDPVEPRHAGDQCRQRERTMTTCRPRPWP